MVVFYLYYSYCVLAFGLHQWRQTLGGVSSPRLVECRHSFFFTLQTQVTIKIRRHNQVLFFFSGVNETCFFFFVLFQILSLDLGDDKIRS